MKLSATQIRMIKENIIQRKQPISIVSVKFAIPIPVLQAVLLDKVRPAPSIVDNDPDFLQYGRPDLRDYMIAKRSVQDGEWVYFNETNFREEYDAGMIDVVTGRSADYFFLYRIPRKVPDTKRQPYYSREFGEG